ncbi:MAG: sigma-70 family RNA polymerase sigma factor [Solirubrobacterales bacterium]|nr:sigma-70 family RNA polymerase sigma factor [Solirubrobacterales bacterium]MBV9365621.1 sigma-70 family RNA polymerase sigma factor [Solirubrobacterales bacterium]
MEVSALRYSGGIGLHARSPLLRLQSDERLVALIRRGSTGAFEVLVARYHARLLAFCRHLLGSREDAEDVLQEVFSAAFNAILDDDRPINVRPWLYRIARNRSLNHLRRIQAVGVDSMDIHLYDHGATTADRVHDREEFRLLVGDIQGLPETQRTALVLREMDALSYEQIAEAMETTVPSVKSLLVRARVSLAEAAEARMLTCEQVRIELGEVAEGLRRRPGPLVRRHLRTCERCSMFKSQLSETSKALTAVLPVGGFFLLRKLAILHLGHSAGAGSSASGAGAAGQAAAVGSTAAAGATAVMGTTSGGFLSASVGAIATKAAAGLAAAALVTAGAVEVEQPSRHVHHRAAATPVASVPASPPVTTTTAAQSVAAAHSARVIPVAAHHRPAVKHHNTVAPAATPATTPAHKTPLKPDPKQAASAATKAKAKDKPKATPAVPPGRTRTQTDATVLAQSSTPAVGTAGASGTVGASGTAGCAEPSSPATGSATTTSTPPPTTTAAPPSSDPGSTTITGPTTTTGQPSADSGTTTTTTVTSAPAPSPHPDPAPASSCAPDSAGAPSGAQPAPSGGTAP